MLSKLFADRDLEDPKTCPKAAADATILSLIERGATGLGACCFT